MKGGNEEAEKFQAEFNGILTIEVPKPERHKRKQITVNQRQRLPVPLLFHLRIEWGEPLLTAGLQIQFYCYLIDLHKIRMAITDLGCLRENSCADETIDKMVGEMLLRWLEVYLFLPHGRVQPYFYRAGGCRVGFAVQRQKPQASGAGGPGACSVRHDRGAANRVPMGQTAPRR